MSRVYAGMYHINGTVEELGLEGVGDYTGDVNSDVLLVDDYFVDSETSRKVLVDILDFNGERVPAYVLIDKLVKVPHKPVEHLPGWEEKARRAAMFRNSWWD